MNTEGKYLEILHLTKEEERILTDDAFEDYDDLGREQMILHGRNIEFSDFNPWWMIVDDDRIPVFDEQHQEEPLIVL